MAKEEIRVGIIETVSKIEMVTWTGWLVYHWDHAHAVALFDEKPDEYEDLAGDNPDRPDDCRKDLDWDDMNTDRCTVDLLEACGIKAEKMDEHDFYYGGGRSGYHPPIPISLIIPEVIADLIDLKFATNC